jgi:hypothetical protein
LYAAPARFLARGGAISAVCDSDDSPNVTNPDHPYTADAIDGPLSDTPIASYAFHSTHEAYKASFNDWAVVVDTSGGHYRVVEVLAQATWSIDVDSGDPNKRGGADVPEGGGPPTDPPVISASPSEWANNIALSQQSIVPDTQNFTSYTYQP